MSFPAWIKDHFAWCPGDCKTDGKCKIFEALEIAWNALEIYEAMPGFNGERVWTLVKPGDTAKESMRRIEDLGK